MSTMDNIRALAYGAELGRPIADRFRDTKANTLYAEAMGGIPDANAQSAGIPMPGEAGAAPGGMPEMPGQEAAPTARDPQAEEQNSWSAKAAREKLMEAMATGSSKFGIEEFNKGLNSLAQRSYVGVNRSYEEYKAAEASGDTAAATSALNRLLRYMPTSSMQTVVPDPNNPGTYYAPTIDPETGKPKEGEPGLVLTPEVIQGMMGPMMDPDKFTQMYGVMTIDEAAALENTRADTAAKKGKERRDEDLHPLEKKLKQSTIAKNLADAAGSGAGGNLKASEVRQRVADANIYLQKYQEGLASDDEYEWYQQNRHLLSSDIAALARDSNVPFDPGGAAMVAVEARKTGSSIHVSPSTGKIYLKGPDGQVRPASGAPGNFTAGSKISAPEE